MILRRTAPFTGYQKALAVLLAAVFILHLPGLFYSFPLKNTVGDEVTTMGAIFKMMNDVTLRPDYASFYHLPVTAYAQLPLYALLVVFLRFSGLFTDWETLRQFVILDYGYFLPYARFITALFALAAISMMYAVAQRLFRDERIALLASFLLSFNFMFFQVTHFARAWALQIFLILLATYVYHVFYTKERHEVKDYLLVSAVTAAALGVHLAASLVYVLFLALYFDRYGWKRFVTPDRQWWPRYKYFAYLQLFIIGWLGLLYWLNPSGFLIYLQQPGLENVNRYWTLGGNIRFYLQVFFTYDTLVALLAVPAFSLLYMKHRPFFFAFIGFIAAWVGILSYAVHAEPRFLIATMPFFVLAASYGIMWSADRIRSPWRRRLLYAGVIIITLYLPLLWTTRIIRPNTLLLARDWIFREVEPDAVIITSNPYLDIPETQAAARFSRERSANAATVERQFVATADPAGLSQPRYFPVINEGFSGLREMAATLPLPVDYLVLTFWEETQRENWLANTGWLQLELVQTYYPADRSVAITDLANNLLRPYATLRAIDKTGPFVEIYRVTH